MRVPIKIVNLLQRPSLVWAWALLLLGLYLFSTLWRLDLVSLHLEESRRAFIALEMVIRQNYWVPTQFGEYYYRKPPLFNWIIIAFYNLLGYQVLSIRLPSVLSLISMGIVIYSFGRNYLTPRILWSSIACFLVSVDVYFYFSLIGEIDLFYALLTLAGFFCVFHFGKREKWYLAFGTAYFFHALGFLTKGIPSIAFAGISTLVVLYQLKAWKELLRLPHLLGSLLFLSLTLGYFYIYSQYNSLEGYISDIWSESGRRTAVGNSLGALFKQLWSFPLDTLKNLVPATLFLPALFSKAIWQKIWDNPYVRFCALAFFFNFLLYWFSPGGKARYIYALYPLAIVVLTYAYWNGEKKWTQMLWKVLVVLAPAVPITFLLLGQATVSVFNTIWALSFSAIFVGIAYVVWASIDHKFWFMILLFVLLRIWFNGAILPVMAADPNYQSANNMALEIYQVVQDEPLHLCPSVKEGSFPFQTVFALERSRMKVLGRSDTFEVGHWYLAQEKDFQDQDIDIVKQFIWRNQTLFLLNKSSN